MSCGIESLVVYLLICARHLSYCKYLYHNMSLVFDPLMDSFICIPLIFINIVRSKIINNATVVINAVQSTVQGHL